MSSTAIVLAGSLALSLPARAANECGVPDALFEVLCDSSDPDYATNFPNGITYHVTDLTMTFDPNVGIIPGFAIDGISIASTDGLVRIDMGPATNITTTSAPGRPLCAARRRTMTALHMKSMCSAFPWKPAAPLPQRISFPSPPMRA